MIVTPSAEDILAKLTKHYKSLKEPIDENNVTILRERLARMTEKIPEATILRNHAQARLGEAKKAAREKLKGGNLTATQLRYAVEDSTSTEQRIFDLSRKLHDDLTNISHNIRKLLDFEIADFHHQNRT